MITTINLHRVTNVTVRSGDGWATLAFSGKGDAQVDVFMPFHVAERMAAAFNANEVTK